MTNILDIINDSGVNPKRVAATHGGEYASPCPICGGTDRLRVWPEKGKWMCRHCNPRGGDAIQFLMTYRGISFKEACAITGKEFKPRDEYERPSVPKRTAEKWEPRENLAPHELWRVKAEEFAAKAHEELFDNKEQLEWLSNRGIGIESIKRFKLGWNKKDTYRARKKWGLDEILRADEKPKKLGLPQGLIIPYYIDGTIHRLRIRQPEQGHKNGCTCFKCSCRYYVVPGSGMSPMIIESSSDKCKVVTVTEAELDAIATAEAAGDITGVWSQGNSSSKPDKDVVEYIKNKLIILNALDFDDAGRNAQDWWNENYINNVRWCVPEGKDPGDYVKDHVGNLREWIVAGLPPVLKPLSPVSPEMTVSDVAENKTPEASPETGVEDLKEKTPFFVKINTAQGPILQLTEEVETEEGLKQYQELTKGDIPLFTPSEVKYVSLATKEAEEEGLNGSDISSLFIHIKNAFGGETKIRGRKPYGFMPEKENRPTTETNGRRHKNGRECWGVNS